MNTADKIIDFLSTFKNTLVRGIRRFKPYLQHTKDDEDISRKEFIFNVIVITSIIILLILDSMLIRSQLIYKEGYTGVNLIFFNSIIALLIFLLYLSYKGFVTIASYVLVVLYYISATYGVLTWGIELPLTSLAYVITIVISGILISTRFTLITTFCIIATLFSLGYMQIHGITTPNLAWKRSFINVKDPIQLSVLLMIITAISWLSNREIERSLKRARLSEQALKKERDLLEIKVEERTRALKITQSEKIAQLYHFAEFGRISSGLFHDLMKPLTTITHYIEETQDHSSEMKAQLNKAIASSRRMGELLRTIKKQIKTSSEVLHFSPNKEISDAIDVLTYQAREFNVSVKFSNTVSFTTFGDAVKFHQIIINLLANAIDACIDTDSPSIRVSLHKRNTTFTLIIKDNGCGIPHTILPFIFDPFFTTKENKGTGLGLSNTKNIIEKNFNGTILVKSTENMGTTFICIFPIENE
jgi:signal transduction histidine kinase